MTFLQSIWNSILPHFPYHFDMSYIAYSRCTAMNRVDTHVVIQHYTANISNLIVTER